MSAVSFQLESWSLSEDKPGQGHRSWALGNADLLTAVVQLANKRAIGSNPIARARPTLDRRSP